MRKRPESVSNQTTSRLPVYLRCLTVLEKEGAEYVSSRTLADRFQLNSDQIRKDLACFGEFGTRGVGYSVMKLRRHLIEILGLGRRLSLVVVGAGRLGSALADYPGFHEERTKVVALFDADPAKVGRRTPGGVPIHALERLAPVVREQGVEIAILAVPARAAQEAAERVVNAGIRAILNFAPAGLKLPREVRVNHVDLTTEVEALAFFLSSRRPAPAARPAAASRPAARARSEA